MARLIDVARMAGVSRSTVSNVFNNPELVRPAVRQRVEKAALELEYIGPDPKGRMLRAGKFNALAVLPPSRWGVAESIANPVFDHFLIGVGEVCDEYDASLVIASDQGDRQGIRNVLVDGVIFGRVGHIDEVEPARLRRLPFAVVDFDPGPGIASVRVDARAGCHAAAKHLIALGHRRFAIMSFLRHAGAARLHPAGSQRTPEAAGMDTDWEKYLGYTDALAEAGIDIGSVPMLQADPADPAAAGLLLDAAPAATAILSMSVMQGIAVLQEARRRGLPVPGELSVVGYNDIADAARSDPPLTTVDGMGRQKGRAAARLVFEGGQPRHEIIAPQLIIRASTGPAPSR